MYCAYCFSDQISSEQLDYTTGVSHAGSSEHWNETVYDCAFCGDETTVVDDMPNLTAEDYRRLSRIYRPGDDIPAHIYQALADYEDSLPSEPDPDRAPWGEDFLEVA